jgi:hypothetical protein
MATEKSQQVMTKVIHRDGMSFTLYSLDGHTWSSKPHELEQIQERIESGRPSFLDKKNQPMAKKRPRPADQPEEQEEELEELSGKEVGDVDEELEEGEEVKKPSVDLAERSLRMRLVAEAPLEEEEEESAPPVASVEVKPVKQPKSAKSPAVPEKKTVTKGGAKKIEAVKKEETAPIKEKSKQPKVPEKAKKAVAKPAAGGKKVAKKVATPKKSAKETSKKSPAKPTTKGKSAPPSKVKKK